MAAQIISGIYKIENTVNGKCYIGSAVNFERRKSEHIRCSAIGAHHSQAFQNAWNKYGPDVFVFSLLEIVADKTLLIAREQYWIDGLNPEYNICKVAGSQLGMKVSLRTRAKISAALLGKKKSPEVRVKMSTAHLGKKIPSVVIAKISIALLGRKIPPDAIAKMSAAQIGKKHTPESRVKMSAVQLGRPKSPESIAKRIATLAAKRELKEFFIAE